MLPIEECCVLIPCHTLEDFPAHASESNARGLLGGWTAPWHPSLIATTRKIPTWCRADTPPPPSRGLALLVPEMARGRLPSDFGQTHSAAANVRVVAATSREGCLRELGVEELQLVTEPLDGGHRRVTVEDFFALGYTFLQVQLMTRQLRYTSNLDEVAFADAAVAAAQAFADRDGESAADQLHTAFDLLAQERDHYFSSDPHLIDLTLLAGSTLGDSLRRQLDQTGPERLGNLLLDVDLLERLASEAPETLDQIRQRVEAGVLSFAGGAAVTSWDYQTLAHVADSLREARGKYDTHLNAAPAAFARYAGGLPGDLAPLIAQLQYRGVIPIDFAGGTGYRDESKLIWHAGGCEMEALTAKPIDAASETDFLRLGASLGSAVDAGDVATALLVHWPGQTCDSFEDLHRAAGWGLALGKFWTLDQYFTSGEQPYHTYTSESLEATGTALTLAVDNGQKDPLSGPAKDFANDVINQAAGTFHAMESMVRPRSTARPSRPAADADSALQDAAESLADALAPASDASAPMQSVVLNPHPVPLRSAVTQQGHPADDAEHVFASYEVPGTAAGPAAQSLVDVPAFGFAAVAPGSGPKKRGWFKKRDVLAVGQQLHNEFLDLVIGDDGSVASLHSGSLRGNRFSWQLAHFDSELEPRYTRMVADSIEILQSDEAVGEIACRGRLIRGDQKVADYRLRYRVERGARVLAIRGQCDLVEPNLLRRDPWQSYLAGRNAVASEASRVQALVRDKVHRVRGRRLLCPLGVVIDEVDRQTLVMAGGRPAYRACGDRMLDTLLQVAGESATEFQLEYGFDVKSPVAFARSRMAVPAVRQVPQGKLPPTGWLLQLSARNVIVAQVTAVPEESGWRLHVLLVETRGKPTKLQLFFARTPEKATTGPQQTPLPVEEDATKVSLGAHEACLVELHFPADDLL